MGRRRSQGLQGLALYIGAGGGSDRHQRKAERK